ncbi:MAG: hypothetical protein Q8N08_04535 [Methanobacteriaceae archaeon]|nr:hypothetical protein [Methanobacteriaceae archaeon]
MSPLVKVLLFLVFFFLFFEAGLFSSYTIVTGQPPDFNKLISMQIDALSSIFNWGGGPVIKQQQLQILNQNEVAEALKNKAAMDGINLQSMSATTIQSKDENIIVVNITTVAYKDSQTGGGTSTGNKSSSGGQIVISPQETYSITATATATRKTKGVNIDVNTIQITSTRKIYNNPSLNGSPSNTRV